jgi:hypothetical protein
MDVLDAVVLIGARLCFFLLHESLHDKLKRGSGTHVLVYAYVCVCVYEWVGVAGRPVTGCLAF